MCYPVCRVVHIKDLLLLIRKSSPCSGGSRFPLSLSEWSLTISLTPYNSKQNVLSASLNTFASFLNVQDMLMIVNDPLKNIRSQLTSN